MAQRKLTKFQLEALEHRARGRAAWGVYGAIIRQQDFNREIERCETEQDRKRLIEKGKCENSRGYWIG